MTDFSKILDKAKELESKMKESQEKIRKIKAEGISGSNSVKVILNGDGEMEKIEIIDEILQDELAVQTLLNAMNRPKIIFMIKEENLIDNTPTDFAETQLIKMFYDKGFDVVDRQLVQALNSPKQSYYSS